MIYHVVSDDIGYILGVYNEALLSEAQELARKTERSTGLPHFVHSGTYSDAESQKPQVGMSISMVGIKI